MNRDRRAIDLIYTNWRGETSRRRIIPRELWFGTTDWHTEEQWLLRAWDVEKQESRDFALRDCNFRQVERCPEEEERWWLTPLSFLFYAGVITILFLLIILVTQIS